MMNISLSGRRSDKGFTLIEILLAIGILAILSTAAIIAINPARQFAQSRDTQRWNDVHAIMNAVYQYAVDNKGMLPPNIPSGDLLEICRFSPITCEGFADLSALTDLSTYLTEIPIDPKCPDDCSGGSGTGYFIGMTADGRVYIQSRYAELSTIELTR